jgi:ArsR family transcriptional regulator, arsenate/arsenite/antimonite-responsive transcriptional repressor
MAGSKAQAAQPTRRIKRAAVLRVAPVTCCEPLRRAQIDDSDAVSLAAAFAALADPARVRLLSLISTAADGEACACNLIEPIGKSQPTVSHHLKVLVEAGLIEREKRGIWTWYRTNQQRVDALRVALS